MMKARLLIAVIVITQCFVFDNSFAIERHVPSQFPTIESAVLSTAPGDTIIISPGTYMGHGNYGIWLPNGKSIIIRSIDPTNSEVTANTVIRCFGSGNDAAFMLDSGATLILEGLTIVGGYNNMGGAVNCRNSTAIIRNCNFEYCYAFDRGGTIYAENSFLMLLNCNIYDSTSGMDGGAVFSRNSQIELDNCIIDESFLTQYSGRGAIYAEFNSSIKLNNCRLTNNWSQQQGSAIYAKNSELTITNSNLEDNVVFGSSKPLDCVVFVENDTTNAVLKIADSTIKHNYGGGIYAQNLTMERCSVVANSSVGIIIENEADITSSLIAGNYSNDYHGSGVRCLGDGPYVFEKCTIADNGYERYVPQIHINKNALASFENCILWGDNPIDYFSPLPIYFCNIVNIDRRWITIDPLFLKKGNWENYSYIEGDYRLGLNSPCINSGDPNAIIDDDEKDIEGNHRIRLGRLDIGAYEAGTHSMDFDKDGCVAFKDFVDFADGWLWQAAWSSQ